MCFRMPENTKKGVYMCVRPTCGSGFSLYQVMVNSMGVCLLENTTVVLATEASHS